MKKMCWNEEEGPPENPTWRDLQNNPYIYTPVVEMLGPDGVVIEGFWKLRGMKKSSPNRFAKVVFDRQFVLKWIVMRLGPLIDSLSYNDLQKLIKEAKEMKKDADTGTAKNTRRPQV